MLRQCGSGMASGDTSTGPIGADPSIPTTQSQPGYVHYAVAAMPFRSKSHTLSEAPLAILELLVPRAHIVRACITQDVLVSL